MIIGTKQTTKAHVTFLLGYTNTALQTVIQILLFTSTDHFTYEFINS